MEKDKILEMFFEPERWEYAIAKGVDKDISLGQLTQLTSVETRGAMYLAIRNGRYQIAPPHTALIPKDTPGEFRTVYVNEPVDRIFLSIANDLLFELCPDMVSDKCKSYQKGIGCGAVVTEISGLIVSAKTYEIGYKSDLHHYFDEVPIKYIDAAFDEVERRFGHSAVIDVIRKYYHSDWYWSPEGELCQKYQSLKQGCSVASWLADVILKDMDDWLSAMDGHYYRYSDDTVFIGPDWQRALIRMKEILSSKEMSVNEKKTQVLKKDEWFKFLGYSLKGDRISMSQSRLKNFQKEIEKRTIKRRNTTPTRAVNSVNRYLYKGDGEHSWATQILPVVNVRHDLDVMNTFVMDCLRAVETGKTKVGGLGYVKDGADGCVVRGIGRNVKSNRLKTKKEIQGYYSLGCMQNALKTRKAAYLTLVASM